MKYKLVCFDVDGTLIDNIKSVWQVMHDHLQTDKHRREDTKNKFYDGKITYRQWAEHDIEMWKEKGARKKDLLLAIKDLKVMPGAIETIKELKNRGIKLAIISGSINIVLEKFIPNYDEIFDDIFISKIFFDENENISKVDATEFDVDAKALALKQICKREGLKLEECVFVGDYLNDIKILKEAGLGIAFNCVHDEVKNAADVVIEKKDLREILKYIV